MTKSKSGKSNTESVITMKWEEAMPKLRAKFSIGLNQANSK